MRREPRMERQQDTPTTARMAWSFTSNTTSAGGIVDQLVQPGVVGSSSMAIRRLSARDGLAKLVLVLHTPSYTPSPYDYATHAFVYIHVTTTCCAYA